MGSKLRHPAVVTIVWVKYEISDSVTVALQLQERSLVRSAGRSDLANQNHSTSLNRAISYLEEVGRLSLLMPPGLLDPSSFASPLSTFSRSNPPLSIFYLHFFWLLSHQVNLALSSFFSSTSLHLLLSLFIFQSCSPPPPSYWLRIAEVCDGSLHYTGEIGLVAL